MPLKETLGYNPYKDLKTSAYSNIEFTFKNASKEFQRWFTRRRTKGMVLGWHHCQNNEISSRKTAR